MTKQKVLPVCQILVYFQADSAHDVTSSVSLPAVHVFLPLDSGGIPTSFSVQ